VARTLLPLLVSVCCGLALAWPFRSYDGSLPAWFVLAPVFWFVARAEKLRWALLCAAAFALAWTAACFTFLWPLTRAGMVAVCLYTSAFYVVALWAVRRLARLGVGAAVFGTAALWALVEMLRANVPVFGFPWMLLGHTLLYNDHCRQGADLLGVYGLSFLVAAVNACFAFGLPAWLAYSLNTEDTEERRGVRRNGFAVVSNVFSSVFLCVLCVEKSGYGLELKNARRVCAVVALLLAGLFCYGAARIASLTPRLAAGPPIGVIQGNIVEKLGRSGEDLTAQLRGHLEMHRKLAQPASPEDKPVLICWAETMVPGELSYDGHSDTLGDEFKHEVAACGIPTLAGSNFRVAAAPDAQETDPSISNGAFLFDGQGAEVLHYCKRRLVAFGEYIPFTRRFPFLKVLRSITRDQYVPGQAPSPVQALPLTLPSPARGEGNAPLTPPSPARGERNADYHIALNICVEDIHPGLAREAIASGADTLINLTNDGWFYGTYGPRSHLQAAAWRAIETRCPLLRVTNTGRTAAVDPLGRIELLVPEETAGTAIVRLRTVAPDSASGLERKRATLTLWLGDSGAALIFAAILVFAIVASSRKYHGSSSPSGAPPGVKPET